MKNVNTRKLVGLVAVIIVIASVVVAIENPFAQSPVREGPISGEPSLAGPPVGVEVGQRAPDFTLETFGGEKVSLSDFRGKVVFVNFWATWCPFCVAEMPDLERVSQEFDGKVVVLGINRAETIDKQKDFLDELELRVTYRLLLDPSDSLATAYGVRVMPTSFILDPDGVIVEKKLGQLSLEEMRQAIQKASPPESAAQVTETPEAQGEEKPAEESTATPTPTPVEAAPEPNIIDPFDLEAVLNAKEGDVVGLRGETLMISGDIRHLVPLSKIMSGGPPPDGIPSIDNPKYISVDEANEWLSDEEFVLAVVYNGIARAYPHQILVWHEIVNDDFNGEPLLITYCPLCFTGIAFKPFIGGEAVEFGTSGKLYNSDLVMYDRKTRSYWSQITGQAIQGELAGLALEKVPLDTIRWGDWKKLHPGTEVLSRETGHLRSYGSDPYGGYYTGGGTFFPVDSDDDRLAPKTIVYGVFIDGVSKAYPEEEVARAGGIVNDIVGGTSLLIVQDPNQVAKPDSGTGTIPVSNRATRIFDRNVDGAVLEFEIKEGKLFDKQTGSEWSFDGKATSGPNAGKELTRIPSSPEFWFARSSFYEDTEIFSAEG